MKTLIQFSFMSLISIMIVAITHNRIGSYPPLLPKLKENRIEFVEAIIIWGIMFSSVTYLMLTTYVFPKYYPFINLGKRLLPLPHLFIMFEVPIFAEIVINKRNRKDLGFSSPIAWKPALAIIGLGALFGYLTFIFESPSPYPLDYLLIGFITPAFTEEWAYRSVIQQKLERALGQKKAWLLSGLLYGFIHVPTDFFGTLWIASGKNISTAFMRLVKARAAKETLGKVLEKGNWISPAYAAERSQPPSIPIVRVA